MLPRLAIRVVRLVAENLHPALAGSSIDAVLHVGGESLPEPEGAEGPSQDVRRLVQIGRGAIFYFPHREKDGCLTILVVGVPPVDVRLGYRVAHEIGDLRGPEVTPVKLQPEKMLDFDNSAIHASGDVLRFLRGQRSFLDVDDG